MRLGGSPYAPRESGRSDAEPHRLHPPGAQPLHQPDDRREHFLDGLSAASHRSALAHRPHEPLCSRRASCFSEVSLDLAPDTPLDRLSPGERQLVEVAKALQLDAEIIIFDEPTTSLTARETERLFALIGRLREAGKTMIYISHILADVDRACRRHRGAARRRAGRRRPEGRLRHPAHDHADGRPADRAALSAAPLRTAGSRAALGARRSLQPASSRM